MTDTRPFVNNATMSEKREIVKNKVQRKDVYSSRAEADYNLAQSGRHAARKIDATGDWAGFLRHPRLPPNSPWSIENAQVPPEEPLGYDINETPVVGEPHEQQLGDGASATPPSPEAVESAISSPRPDVEASTATSNSQPAMKRRRL
jgi:hypothetical protein